MTTVLDAHGFPIEDFAKHYEMLSLQSKRVHGCSVCVFASENCSHHEHITENNLFQKQVGACGNELNSYYVKL